MTIQPRRAVLLAGFGARVCQLRVERGLTLADLGRLAGMPPEALDAIEDGDLEADMLGVFAIAAALGVPAAELFIDDA